MVDKEHTNRLINEKSPYLLQHAHNPVDWYPWSEEAFRKAKEENKLVFLSIGYSTCHWCHVMEKESFENEYVAREMNDLFVCIKVDREERPDIDSAYMTVSQMMTGTGGWPLNIIMTPEKVPVFALTYIPRESRRGMVGIVDLTRQLKELWTQGREEVERRAEEVLNNLKRVAQSRKGKSLNQETIDAMISQLKQSFDSEYGGFGNAPKFPSPQNLMFLMRAYRKSGDKELLEMVKKTLVSMRMGGIYDQLGFGFHRYSTDAGWFLPHFEKMLYDQALQMMAYTEAYQVTGEKLFKDVVYEIASFIEREMTSPEGPFYSAIDADSENEEGKFYTWRATEILQLLGKEEADIFMSVYNCDLSGNYIEEATGRNTGKNILFLNRTLESEAARLGLPTDDLRQLLDRSRENLFQYRARRTRPHLDDKILTDNNGLMVAALSKAHKAFGEEAFLALAKKAADFLLDKMYRDGRLLHRYRDGESAISGYLDDYAFLAFGLIELFESTMDARYLEVGKKLSETADLLFKDEKEGGYFGSPSDGEVLPVRMKEGHDGAIPSGNSVQMLNLLRIGTILSDPAMKEVADSIADAFSSDLQRGAMYHCFMGIGIMYSLNTNYLVKIGEKHPLSRKALKYLQQSYEPFAEPLFLNDNNSKLTELLGEASSAGNAHSKILVCIDKNCFPPAENIEKLKELIKN